MKKRVQILCCILLLFASVLTPCRTSKAAESTAGTYEETILSDRKIGFDPAVTFNKYKKDCFVGDDYTLSVDEYSDKNLKFSFKSTDSSILSVKQTSSTSCKYTGVSYGTAKISVKVTDDSGFLGFLFEKSTTINLKISVTPYAVSVKFNHAVRTVSINHKIKLSTTIRPSISEEVPTFESSSTKIARVTQKGKVTGKKEGTAYITATLNNGKSAKCKILVREASSDDGEPDDSDDADS